MGVSAPVVESILYPKHHWNRHSPRRRPARAIRSAATPTRRQVLRESCDDLVSFSCRTPKAWPVIRDLLPGFPAICCRLAGVGRLGVLTDVQFGGGAVAGVSHNQLSA